MSFKFNEALFKDSSFNERLKQKLSNALNNAFYPDTGEDDDVSTTTASTQGEDDSNLNKCNNDGTTGVNDSNINENKNRDTQTNNVRTPGARHGRKRGNNNNNNNNNNSQPQRDKTSHSKSDILRSKIVVKRVNFPKLPKFEILDADIITQPTSLVKGICKIQLEDAMIQLHTVIESNLLLANMKSCPKFLAPDLIENNSFPLPITMTFRNINLEAISNMFVKSNSGVSISFNDVRLEFKFECSLKILQATMEKRLKDSLHSLFKEILPAVLFNMSQNWFSKPAHSHSHSHSPQELAATTKSASQGSIVPSSSVTPSGDTSTTTWRTLHPKVVLDENDLQDLSPRTMLRLSAIISSRYTLSLHGTNSNLRSMATISGCLEKQNLCRFISRMPSISNYYMSYVPKREHSGSRDDSNALPMVVLKEGKYDLRKIIEIQDKLFERSSTDGESKPHRRVIKLGNSKNNNNKRHKATSTRRKHEEPSKEIDTGSMTPNRISRPILTPLTTPTLSTSMTGMWTPPLSSTGSPFASRNTSLSSLAISGFELEKVDSGKPHSPLVNSNSNERARDNKNYLNAHDTGNSPFFSGHVMKGISSYVGIHNHYSHCGWKWGDEESHAGYNVLTPPPPYK